MAGLFDFITSKDPESVERRLRLAQGLGGMTTNPNVGLQNSIQGRLEGIQKTRAATSASEKLASQSGMAIKMLGDKFPMLTQALQAGIISPNDAITAARKGADVKVVGKSLVDMEGNVLFTSEDGSGGETTAFQTLKARAKAANLVEGTPAYQQFMVQGGANKGMELVVGADGSVTMKQGGGVSSSGRPKTEGQSNAAGFYSRMSVSGPTIDQFENEGTKFGQALIAGVPFNLGNFAQSEDYQLYKQAKEDFINAQLRRESGAVIGESEFDNANVQYFPIPGDSQAVITQKRRNRQIVTEAMKLAANITGGNEIPAAGANSTGKTVKTYDTQGNLISG